MKNIHRFLAEQVPGGFIPMGPQPNNVLLQKQKKQDEQDLQRYERVAARQQDETGEVDPGVQSAIGKLKNGESVTKVQSPKAAYYYSTKTGISGTPTDHAMAARNKAEQRLASGEELGPNELFYLQYIGQGANKKDEKGRLETQGTKMSPEEIERTHGYASSEFPKKQSYQIPSATSTLPDSDLPPTDTKISGMYWPSYKDFYDATGEKYDAKNPKHRQLFFDLNSQGESSVPPTAGVGQGPAYNSLEYHTMKRRPSSLPKYDQYGRVPDQTYSGTWSGSDPAMGPKAAAQREKSRNEINAAERRELAAQPLPGPSRDELQKVSTELGMNPQDLINQSGYASQRYGIPQTGLDSQRRDYYSDEIRRDLETSGARTIQEPERQKAATNQMTQNAMNALIRSAKKGGQAVGEKISQFLRLNLAQTMPTTMREKLYGDPGAAAPMSGVERGQQPIYFNYAPFDPTVKSVIGGPENPIKINLKDLQSRGFNKSSNLPNKVARSISRLKKIT
jgi:hypothetical protein